MVHGTGNKVRHIVRMHVCVSAVVAMVLVCKSFPMSPCGIYYNPVAIPDSLGFFIMCGVRWCCSTIVRMGMTCAVRLCHVETGMRVLTQVGCVASFCSRCNSSPSFLKPLPWVGGWGRDCLYCRVLQCWLMSTVIQRRGQR